MEVSVLVTTYNHEKYIAQALDSILMQETDFDYEIVILEDCSTDATREIVLAYRKKHPEKIHLRLPDRNECSNRPFAEEFQAAPSRYIATLDGDDFWTSPKKLQKQVKFLESHPDCAICFHNALMVYEDGKRIPLRYSPAAQKPISQLEELWQYSFIPVCTPMFRKDAIGEFPEWYNNVPFACNDWALHIFCAQYGKIGYIDEVLAVYRIHKEGLWSKFDNIQRLEARVAFYETMNANLNFQYNHIVEPLVFAWRRKLAVAHAIAKTVQTTLPLGAVLLVMTMANKDLRQFQGYQVRAFPDRSGKPRQRVFASGSAGSAEAPWIAAGGTYEFRLYGGAAQDELLASVTVTQNVTGLYSLHSEEEPRKGGPFIKASPNPVPLATEFAKTTISWNTGDGSPGVIHVFVDDKRIHYPADSAEAIVQLETLRAKGGEFLVVPRETFELLEEYPKLKEHLEQHYQLLAPDEDICLIYDLREMSQQRAPDIAKD